MASGAAVKNVALLTSRNGSSQRSGTAIDIMLAYVQKAWRYGTPLP